MRSTLRPCSSLVVGLAFAACHAPKTAPAKPAEPARLEVPHPDPWAAREVVRQQPRVEPRAVEPRARPQSLRQKLRTAKLQGVTFGAENGDYPSVIRAIRTITDVPIVTTPEARAVFESEGLELAMGLRGPVSVHDLLDLMVGRSDELRWHIQHDVVFLEARGSGSNSSLSLRYYDVRQLVMARTEFIAPRIDGIPTGDDERPRTGAEAEERVQTFDSDSLLDTLKIATDPKFWENEPDASIELAESGTLIVRATPEIHRRIRQLIGG